MIQQRQQSNSRQACCLCGGSAARDLAELVLHTAAGTDTAADLRAAPVHNFEYSCGLKLQLVEADCIAKLARIKAA